MSLVTPSIVLLINRCATLIARFNLFVLVLKLVQIAMGHFRIEVISPSAEFGPLLEHILLVH